MKMETTKVSYQGWARFWAADLHVHTPGSRDAREEDFGTPDDIVKAAIAAGLDVIAVTDHNTANWCEPIAAAAASFPLVVLPGFELSTPQGHLLGLWEEGTSPSILEDVLTTVGIKRAQQGALDVVTTMSMIDCAKEIEEAGGMAIAAHIDKERGILTQPVQTFVNQILREECIRAFEYVLEETPRTVKNKLGDARLPAFVQSSDTYDAALSRHALSGIGLRRTWFKAARPDLTGLRHAVDDPELRIELTDPWLSDSHPTVDAVSIDGGFLAGTTIELSPDLNSLLGGTGAGKSLVLEAVRFALEQQVDGAVFRTIYDEVNGRLQKALGEGTEVAVEIRLASGRYRVKRTFTQKGSRASVEQDVDGDWVQIDRVPSDLIPIAAFSQGEILEYARQPVGRVGLIDVHLDLSSIESKIQQCEQSLRANAINLVKAREGVDQLRIKAARVDELKERERTLSALFDEDLVKEQRLWTAERASLKSLADEADGVRFTRPPATDEVVARITPAHETKFEQIQAARNLYIQAIDEAEISINTVLEAYRGSINSTREEIDAEFQVFESQVDQRLEKAGKSSLSAIRRELESVQGDLTAASQAAEDSSKIARPRLQALESERENYLQSLKESRDERRALRRVRVRELNRKTASFVKIDIPAKGDTSAFRTALDSIKTGSRVRDTVLDVIAEHIHPYRFARALWDGKLSSLNPLPEGVDAADISRLHTNIADRNYWTQLLDVQQLDTPDTLNVKFKKPEGGDYVSIEDLSHGQKCTAILVILLADGDSPVLIDQPEDALHAPWIEDYLVDRLRELRGSRQYVFATRSAGLVVSADAEQLITMHASATKGAVEAVGSLERHDLNKLALHHLEGGKIPFGRRTQKLRSSLDS
ncbi:MAG: AAA family ATPase [Microbacterium enclense]